VLVIALIVLALAAVVALAGARASAFGLRIANAGVARLDLRAAADNALERALAARPPGGGSGLAIDEERDGHAITVRLERDRRTPLGMPPADGFSLGLGGAAFGAEHYTARAVVGGPRGGATTAEQQFYVLVPEGP
jgi:hypothetical protein